MWTVVYIASNHAMAEMLKDLLTKEGILVMLRPIGLPHMGSSAQVEVLVPQMEAKEAFDILAASPLPVEA